MPTSILITNNVVVPRNLPTRVKRAIWIVKGEVVIRAVVIEAADVVDVMTEAGGETRVPTGGGRQDIAIATQKMITGTRRRIAARFNIGISTIVILRRGVTPPAVLVVAVRPALVVVVEFYPR